MWRVMQVSGQWVPKHRTGYWKGPTTIYVVSQWDCIASWWPAVERRCCLEAVVETGTKHAARYRGAEPYRHRCVITPSLYLTRSDTSSQWSSVCIIKLFNNNMFLTAISTQSVIEQKWELSYTLSVRSNATAMNTFCMKLFGAYPMSTVWCQRISA